MMNIYKISVPEIFFGRGSLKYAGVTARRLGAEKILFVSDSGLEKTGWLDLIFEILERENLQWVKFTTVVPNPRDLDIEEGARLYRQEGCDVVMSLGGGSPMDTAKGIALLASNGGCIRDYEGANRIQRPLPPMIFLPSTAGGGSDISQFAIITDAKRNIKMSIISRTLVPNISIVDPIFLMTNSEGLIITSAIDALAHAIESYVSLLASPLTEVRSLKAIDLILKHLPLALKYRQLDDLENLAIASTSAAIAFSNASLGMEHAIAHSLGGMLDVVHGLIHPILLAPVMRYNLPVCVNKIAKFGKIILGKRLRTDESTARAGIEKLEEFCASLNVTTRLRDIVSDRETLPLVCQMAMYDSCLLTNPRPATWEQMLQICEEVW